MKINNDDVCEICLSGEFEDGNPIVFCDSCNCCVHANCARIACDIWNTDTSYFCPACAFSVENKPTCVLCKNNCCLYGEFINDDSELFAHIPCFRIAPKLVFTFEEKLQIPEVSVLKAIESDFVCQHCGVRGGVIVDCCFKKCKHFYHPSCFLLSGGAMSIRESDQMEFVQAFCQEHSQGQVTVQRIPMLDQFVNRNFTGFEKQMEQYAEQGVSQHVGVVGQDQQYQQLSVYANTRLQMENLLLKKQNHCKYFKPQITNPIVVNIDEFLCFEIPVLNLQFYGKSLESICTFPVPQCLSAGSCSVADCELLNDSLAFKLILNGIKLLAVFPTFGAAECQFQLYDQSVQRNERFALIGGQRINPELHGAVCLVWAMWDVQVPQQALQTW